MGYCLLYETMLPTVLYARDKWLAKDGIIMPDKASMYITAIGMSTITPIGYKYLLLEDRKYKNSKINWWDNVYGFDMSCMKKVAVSEPLVDCCENHQVCCRSQKFIEFDLYKVTPFSLKYPALRCQSIKIFLGKGRRSFIQRKNRDNSYSKRIYSWAISLLSM